MRVLAVCTHIYLCVLYVFVCVCIYKVCTAADSRHSRTRHLAPPATRPFHVAPSCVSVDNNFSISPSGSNFLETISDSVCVVQVSEAYHHGAQLCRNHQVTGFDSFEKKLFQFSQAILLTRESFEILPVIEFDQSPIGFVFHCVPIWTQGKIQLSSV